jgi:hypothetical protein
MTPTPELDALSTAHTQLREHIKNARANGHTWDDIATVLSVPVADAMHIYGVRH